MYCQNCGRELPDGARFCDKCGTPVQVVPSGQGKTEPGSARKRETGSDPARKKEAKPDSFRRDQPEADETSVYGERAGRSGGVSTRGDSAKRTDGSGKELKYKGHVIERNGQRVSEHTKMVRRKSHKGLQAVLLSVIIALSVAIVWEVYTIVDLYTSDVSLTAPELHVASDSGDGGSAEKETESEDAPTGSENAGTSSGASQADSGS